MIWWDYEAPRRYLSPEFVSLSQMETCEAVTPLSSLLTTPDSTNSISLFLVFYLIGVERIL